MKTKIAKIRKNSLFNRLAVTLSILTLLLANLAFAPKALATTLTHTAVMEYNMNSSGTSQVAVAFAAGAADASGNVVLTFTGWTGTTNGIIGATGSQTVSGATCQAVTGATNVLTTTGVTSTPASGIITVAFTGPLTTSSSYCFTLTYASAVTNPAAAGVYQVGVAVDGTDTNTVAIDVISNDQVTVSATVVPTFTMLLSGNTDSLGTLSANSLSTSTSNVTATINTNALSGWYLWAMDSQAGLHSTIQTKTIGSVATGSNHTMNAGTIGTEAYALAVPSVSAGSINANYAYNSDTTGGGLSSSTFNQIASDGAAAATDVVAIKELADISPTTPAANDYADIITLVGAGSF